MTLPVAFSELSTTAGTNSALIAGSSSPTVIDDHLRAVYAFIASVYANSGNGWASPYLTVAGPTYTGTLSGPSFLIPQRRSGFFFANGVSAGTTGSFNVDVTGFSTEGTGSADALSAFYLVTFFSSAAGHITQGVGLYTNDFDGKAVFLAELGSRETGGTVAFTTDGGNKPRVSVTNTTGISPTYYCQVVYLN